MKKLLLLIVLVALVAGAMSSCTTAYENRKSRTCPSHDPMYFRR